WKGWAILLRQKQKKLIMLPSETMIWQPEFTDKTLSRKPGAVQVSVFAGRALMDELVNRKDFCIFILMYLIDIMKIIYI
ncbi:hypothetical protein, partial [Escherichia coli]|uniref:hypothetical protein n=1 Tax=Escherichia coli TaxID=562 RepID=UPI0030056E88